MSQAEHAHAMRVIERAIERGWLQRQGDRIVRTKTYPGEREFAAAMEDLRPLIEAVRDDD